jgi:asparagine synthase (glutamine-hydrolysing)
MFALIWHDAGDDAIYVARDRFGEIPLHAARIEGGWAIASEVKALPALGARARVASWVPPGGLVRFARTAARFPSRADWSIEGSRWYEAPCEPIEITTAQAGPIMRGLVERACEERAISDVPVCTLLSGGIDSTAVAYHLRGHVPSLVAYTAVYNPKSQDARLAREAADALGIELREVPVPLPSRGDLAKMVAVTEMPYKAQIEIAWPCWWLAERMAADGFKVCFSGEGSDELWASYGFSYHVMERTFAGRLVYGDDSGEFDLAREREWTRYRRDTFTAQHRKNFARCNKIFMSHGVECRLPYLHTPLVEFALSCPVDASVVRSPGKGPTKQKAVMYEAYDELLPAEIVRRHKVAFQEGMGLKDAIETEVFPGMNPRTFYNRAHREAYA